MARSMTLLLLLLLAVASLQAAGAARGEGREVLRTHMSTKTLYAPPLEQQQSPIIDTDEQQCVPVQLNFAVRHGTRNPTMKDITRISKTHTRLVATSGTSLSWLDGWENPFPEETAAWLADAGVVELVAMGERLRERFTTEKPHFRSDKFVFEHTWKARTRQSAEAFAFGFFGGLQPVFYDSPPVGDDQVLRFFDNCPAFETEIERNDSATAQHKLYRESEQMQTTLASFRRLSGAPDMTQKDLEAAYAGCAFDVAVRGVMDQWCALFDDEMLLTMDYFQDLKHFYKKSHGHALAFEIASPLLQDLFVSMKARVDGKSSVEGHFRFAHAETILPLAALLNVSEFDLLASDRAGHFRADTPLDVAMNRKFKSSELAPFAANIGFVLYECTVRDKKSAGDDRSVYKVKTLLNEREVAFPACDNDKLCTFEVLERVFRHWLYEFDFQKRCAM